MRCYYNEYSNNEYSLPSSFTIKKTKEFLFRLNYKTNEEYVCLIKKRIDNSDGKEFFGFVGKIKVNNDDIIEDIFEKNKLLSGIVLNVKNDDMLIDYNSVISINEERSDMMNIYLYKNKEEQEHFISTILIHKTYTINDIKWYVSSIEMKNKPQCSYVDHSFFYIEEGDIDLNQTVEEYTKKTKRITFKEIEVYSYEKTSDISLSVKFSTNEYHSSEEHVLRLPSDFTIVKAKTISLDYCSYLYKNNIITIIGTNYDYKYNSTIKDFYDRSVIEFSISVEEKPGYRYKIMHKNTYKNV